MEQGKGRKVEEVKNKKKMILNLFLDVKNGEVRKDSIFFSKDE